MSPCPPPPPPYVRTVWEFGKANVEKIKASLNAVDWRTAFSGLSSEEMADTLTKTMHSIMSENIPNKVIKCNDKDPSWITHQLKTAIKRINLVFNKFLDRGKKQEDWNYMLDNGRCNVMLIKKKRLFFQTKGLNLNTL